MHHVPIYVNIYAPDRCIKCGSKPEAIKNKISEPIIKKRPQSISKTTMPNPVQISYIESSPLCGCEIGHCYPNYVIFIFV